MAEAWVTLALDDKTALGALVLGHSLRRVGTTRQLHVISTPEVSTKIKENLSHVFDTSTEIDLSNGSDSDEAKKFLQQRPEFTAIFTKFCCWRLTHYRKCVFVDPCCMIVQECDELFEYQELSAAHSSGFPDLFSSSVFVFVPSNETCIALMQYAVTHGSFDGQDRGILNRYFHDWNSPGSLKRLPFVYNMAVSVAITDIEAFEQYSKDAKIINFSTRFKPWDHQYDLSTNSPIRRQETAAYFNYFELWWKIFSDEFVPNLSETQLLEFRMMPFRKRIRYCFRQTGVARQLLAFLGGFLTCFGICFASVELTARTGTVMQVIFGLMNSLIFSVKHTDKLTFLFAEWFVRILKVHLSLYCDIFGIPIRHMPFYLKECAERQFFINFLFWLQTSEL